MLLKLFQLNETIYFSRHTRFRINFFRSFVLHRCNNNEIAEDKSVKINLDKHRPIYQGQFSREFLLFAFLSQFQKSNLNTIQQSYFSNYLMAFKRFHQGPFSRLLKLVLIFHGKIYNYNYLGKHFKVIRQEIRSRKKPQLH